MKKGRTGRTSGQSTFSMHRTDSRATADRDLDPWREVRLAARHLDLRPRDRLPGRDIRHDPGHGTGDRERLRGPAAGVAGGVSGLVGGMVGNQGGIRSAALLGFHLPRHAFVATATAIALLVDLARMPVYFAVEGRAIVAEWPLLVLAVAGVVAGTLAGERVLTRIPEAIFRRVVAALIIGLGVYMVSRGV